MQFYRHVACLKTALSGHRLEAFLTGGKGELRHLAAVIADGEAGGRLMLVSTAGNKGIEAFDTVDEPALTEGLQRAIDLDPLGAALDYGPELTFELMRGNAEALRACLSEAAKRTR